MLTGSSVVTRSLGYSERVRQSDGPPTHRAQAMAPVSIASLPESANHFFLCRMTVTFDCTGKQGIKVYLDGQPHMALGDIADAHADRRFSIVCAASNLAPLMPLFLSLPSASLH